MSYTSADIGQRCKQCPEGKIIQFMSGKIGCNNWKNHKPRPASTPNPYVPPEAQGVSKSLSEPQEKVKIATEMMLLLQEIDRVAKSNHNMLNELIDWKNEEFPKENS
jgi:hypothetical protein